MKQVITKEEVSEAIEQLTAQGKRPTLAAIHALLGNRGSMSTLVRLKAELQDTTAAATNDNPDGLRAFREMWAIAAQKGRLEQEQIVAELREALKSVAAENERLEGQLAAARTQTNDLERAKSLTESEFREYHLRVQTEVDEARKTVSEANAAVADALGRLAESQSKHAAQLIATQAERDGAIKKAHDMELRLVRAVALLETAGTAPCGQVCLDHNS